MVCEDEIFWIMEERSIYDWDGGGAWLYGVENVKQGTQYIVVLPIPYKTLVFQGFLGIVFYQRKTVFA